jgi:hypothetical protein
MSRPALAVMLALMLTLALAAPAHAAKPPGMITCLATPRLTTTPSGTVEGQTDWIVKGSGACVASGGTLTVKLRGAGTSTGLGLCGGLLVQDLDIEMTVDIERVFSGHQFTAVNHWVAALTTFPLATPFVVNNTDNSKSVGAGVIFSHIFLNCPDDNVARESSTVTWVQDYAASGATWIRPS